MRLASWVVLSVALGGSAGAEKQVLTVEQAVDRALHSNPRLLAAEARVRGGEQAAKSVGAHMLPAVALSEEFQHWDSEFDVAFTAPGLAFPPLKARDQDTNTFVAAAQQPLLGLLHLSHEYLAQKRAAEAGAEGYRAGRAQLREAVQTGYLRLFEARALGEVARAAVAELEEQVQVAQAKLKAGVLTNADVLRVQVAQANAKQQEIGAHTQERVARAALLGALALKPDDAEVEFAEPTRLLEVSRGPRPSYDEASRRALAHRPEMGQVRLSLESARLASRARFFQLLPEVNAEGAYLRVDGQVFQPKNSGFFGIKAEWPIWTWGATYFAQRAASAQAEGARYDFESQERQVGVEVESDLAQADAAASAVEVAEQAIASAQEAYRVTQALVKAGSATTTDLLDAQAALTQARSNLARAQYEQAIARVQLSRATGE
jgi:outer membrane protein TolC